SNSRKDRSELSAHQSRAEDANAHKGLLLLVARSLVLFVRHFLHPIDDLAVQLFLDGDMRHGCGGRGAVPMLLARRARDYVARSNYPDRATPALDQPAAGRCDQGLTQRMRVPIASSVWLERD